ncbi:MAG: cation:proton antiporter, partial [Armatimonadota bacterium]
MTLPTLLLSLIIIWVTAKLLGEVAERFKLPAVLGEILAGAIVGSHALGLIPQHEFLQLLAEIGVIVLLFEIGLQTDLLGLLRVGPKSLVVALVGIALPMASGYLLGIVFHLSFNAALLIGAALSATSIAISSRTLSDLGALESEEGRIVLGAAVLDDVLGLVILGVVVAVASGQAATPLFVGLTTLRAQLDELEAEVGLLTATDPGEDSLTTAELRTLQFLPTHLSMREVGERLYVSRNTV